MKELTLGSLFDGIGGFPLAGSRYRIKALWASEIEPFPIKVTKIRFPDMNHLGDITKINGAEIEPVDIITFGSPCQDLSVAGKRAGLAGERSGLFMEAVRIIKEMRNTYDGANKLIRPRFTVWENVPGAFSSNKGEDFRAVLEELAKVADETVIIPEPPKGKWSTVGTIMGDGWSIAWRILDAQYWGVPQRRRRIFLVADFGGQSAPEILFKRKGLSRYSQESGDEREATSTDVERSVDETSDCLTPWDVQSRRIHKASGKWPALYGGEGGGRGYAAIPETPKTMLIRCGKEGGGKGPLIQDDKSATLSTLNILTLFQPKIYGIGAYNSEGMKSNNPHSGIYEADTSRTLDLNGGSPACNQGGMAIVECKGYRMTAFGEYADDDSGSTVKMRDYKDATDLVVSGLDIRNLKENGDISGTLQAKKTGGYSLNYTHPIRQQYSVRRLTPLECERLQGYPDGWTDIEGASDSARYKALGNSVAIPCVEYVMEGISEVLSTEEGERDESITD